MTQRPDIAYREAVRRGLPFPYEAERLKAAEKSALEAKWYKLHGGPITDQRVATRRATLTQRLGRAKVSLAKTSFEGKVDHG